MSEKILVPVLGESITEATVAKWLKNKGDSVKIDEPIIELETDKVNLEVPSPVNGVLRETTAKDGEVVEVGAVLGLVDEKDNAALTEEIHKEEPKNEENNIVSLDLDRQKDSPKIFDNAKNILKFNLI